MYLVYIDESGDDGYPVFSSQVFVLTACYFKDNDFHHNFELIKEFRKQLKAKYGLHTGLELHLRELIQNKKPYTGIGLSKVKRQAIVDEIFKFIASEEFKIKFINVAIDKNTIRTSPFNVLEKTLTYLVRRIENDMKVMGSENFLCISDQGRVHVMNKTARKLRKIAFLPSKVQGTLGNKPIKYMIEDIFEKDSKQSYFIQFSDCVSRLVNLYTLNHECNPKQNWSRKTSKFLKLSDDVKYLELIKGKLNLKASSHKYGIKYV